MIRVICYLGRDFMVLSSCGFSASQNLTRRTQRGHAASPPAKHAFLFPFTNRTWLSRVYADAWHSGC